MQGEGVLRHVARRDIDSVNIGRLALGKSQQLAASKLGQPEIGKVIIQIDDGRAACRQPVVNLALGSSDAFATAETFQMRRADIDDDRRTGLYQTRGVRNFASMVGAELKDTELMLITQAQQRQWHADVIIEIAQRRQRLALLLENARCHFLGGCLAGTAGHGHPHETREACTPGRRNLAKRLVAISNDDLRNASIRIHARRHSRHGALFRRLMNQGVGIEVWARQRDENIIGLERAGIAGKTANIGIQTDQLTTDHCCDFRQSHAVPLVLSASRTCSTSLKG